MTDYKAMCRRCGKRVYRSQMELVSTFLTVLTGRTTSKRAQTVLMCKDCAELPQTVRDDSRML